MRTLLLVLAGLVLAGFVAIAVVIPQMATTDAKEAAQSLISGAEPAKQQIAGAAQKAGSLAGSGSSLRAIARVDPNKGELKWVVSENGLIRGWNEKNAIEVTLTPELIAGKVTWTCKGFPHGAMPAGCGGR